jgi:hypothetical protein
LDVFTSTDPSILLAIEFLNAGKDHCLGRHVDTHAESLSGEEDLEQAFLEEQLNHFLDNGQQTSMMDANPSF